MGTSRILRALLCVGLCTKVAPVWAQSAPDAPTENHGTHAQDAAPTAEPSATAEPETAETPQAALDHYLKGRRHYLAGRYREALVELKAALELDRNAPDLIYNVARVYENLGELDEAIAYYQRYLGLLPLSETEERDRTEKTIRRLQGAKRETAARKPAPVTPAAPPHTHAGRADLAFWITGGAALALLAGGATSGVLAIRKYDAAGAFVVGADGSLAERQKLSDAAKRFAVVADGLFIGSGVALTTAALLFLLRDAQEPKPQVGAWHFGLNLGAHRAQLSLSGHF